ncbi:MAG: ABC transporter permease [Desulfurococcaceae archaeon]|nr:ABC transporter permease [Desulfurococcaceae archaeon]
MKVLKLARRAYAVLKAYALSELARSRGIVYGLVGIALWILLFTLPVSLFSEPGSDPAIVSAQIFTGVMVFLFYSAATWDWAAELRWMINDGRLEYYIASGSGFLPHYLGILPVSLTWVAITLCVTYILLVLVFKPPILVVRDPALLIYGFTLLLVTLLGYALILGGTILSAGASSGVVELIGFILPVATGGLTPLARLPRPVQVLALSTPFSYPAELLRHSLLSTPLVLSLEETCLYGGLYTAVFFTLSVLYFKHQYRKLLREGARLTAR